MSQAETRNADGLKDDGVSYYEADAARLQSYASASQNLAKFEVPELVHQGNRNERLFVAGFDGTGNDVFKDPDHATNIAKMVAQIKSANKSGNDQIYAGYVPGPGTENSFVRRTVDGINGNTYDERLEEMYKQFIDQAWKWKHENPDVKITIADIGFSRGADQAAGFARMVHERGIQDPTGAHYTRNARGEITHVQYTRPALVGPGEVAQVVGLLDPVGTGEPVRDHDRRLPPSVISGFQIIAGDERRGLFKSDRVIDPGMTADGRFLAVEVAGAHSDIGGSYHRDGLAIRNFNMLARYINAASDQPLIKEQPEPNDPRLNVVHRSEEGMLLYRVWHKIDRDAPGGYNELLVPKRQIDKVADPLNAEPRDDALNARFERHAVGKGAQAIAAPSQQEAPGDDLAARLDRLTAFGQNNDWVRFGQENQALAFGEAGRAMMYGATASAAWQEQAQQAAALQQATQQQAHQAQGMSR